jgi:hypothetical protein
MTFSADDTVEPVVSPASRIGAWLRDLRRGVHGMDELTLSVVGIDFPNTDRSKSNRRMELLLCAPGEPVDLRREPKTRTTPTPWRSSAHAASRWAICPPTVRR